jgi:hypothetical protein
LLAGIALAQAPGAPSVDYGKAVSIIGACHDRHTAERLGATRDAVSFDPGDDAEHEAFTRAGKNPRSRELR